MHFDENSENNVIVALCVSPHAPQIFRELVADDFYGNQSRRRFEWLQEAYQSGTFNEAKARVVERGLPEVAEQISVFDAVHTVRNHAIRRKMEEVAEEVRLLCNDYSKPISEVQTNFKKKAVEIMDSRVCKTPSETKDDIQQFQAEIVNDNRAFVTGLPFVDRRAPVQPGDFAVLAARPSVGKSAIGIDMLLNNFLGPEKHRGIYFCIEMDRKQTYARMISHMSGISLSKFLNIRDYPMTPEENDVMRENLERIEKDFPDKWFQQGVVTLEDIRQNIELERPEFILVDYVQVINHYSRHGDRERLSEISIELRQMALEYGIAVVVLAQLNRDAEGGMPTIAQIKGSGQFEQDATHIFLLDRPESERTTSVKKRNYYDRQNQLVEVYLENAKTNRAALLISKNRNGPTFYEILNFNPRTTAFTPYE